jgi:uncharacterized membrane protein YbhN (UPF0104 family)
MSGVTATVSPLRDASRPRRFVKLLLWALAIAVVLVVCRLLGFNIWGWLKEVWDQVKAIPLGYLIAGLFFQTLQTTFTALAWLGILRAAYPDVTIEFRAILAAYAVSVALNGFLPANMGTFVLLFMLVALIPGAGFASIFAAYLVQKIFFTVISVFVYLYLFLSVPDMEVEGSRSPDFGNIKAHPLLWIILIGGAVALVVVLCRIFWRQLKKLWEKAKVGGAILNTPRKYFTKVFAPSLAGWIAKLFVIGIFLAAYGIPVTFHTIMSVVGSNSIANTVSVTPGGVGVNQAMNVAALDSVTDATTATAYSIGQQLITTAWNQVFAIALVIWVFGWTGGKTLVTESYGGAKEKVVEQKEERRQKKEEKRAEREASGETTTTRLRSRLRRTGDDEAAPPPDEGGEEP